MVGNKGAKKLGGWIKRVGQSIELNKLYVSVLIGHVRSLIISLFILKTSMVNTSSLNFIKNIQETKQKI